MFRTVNLFFASLCILLSLSSMATDTAECGEGSRVDRDSANLVLLAGPCVHFRDQFQCTSYPTGECFWDVADQRCESTRNSEDRCSLINDPSLCYVTSWNCFWDNDDQRCERRD